MAISIDLTDKDVRNEVDTRVKAGSTSKKHLIGLPKSELIDALRSIGIAEKQLKMRASQLWHWFYVRGVSDFADMHNVSKDLRQQLDAHFDISRPEIIEEQISSDGTRKWLMRFPSGGAGKPVAAAVKRRHYDTRR